MNNLFSEGDRNDILKHPVSTTILEESEYVYEIDEDRVFNLTKKSEESELPESTTWEGIVSILNNSDKSILVISENKYFYRKHF